MNGAEKKGIDEARHALELLERGDAFLETDAAWRILRVNANHEQLWRRSRSDTVGRVLWEVWPELANPESACWRECHRCVRERVAVQFVELYAPLQLWAAITAYPTSTGGIAVFLRDVTAQRRAEEALRASDRRKSELLALVSHELRNPLVPIRNSVHVLGRADPGSDQARRARAIIARQVDHVARLVDDLLDVTRVSAGKLRLHRTRLDLVTTVAEAIEDMRPLFAQRGVALDLCAPSAPVWVDGDRTRLAQIVSNLLHNAAKFTDRGGHVAVTVDGEPGGARVAVRDDGVGIAPELMACLFEPFVQGESTLHRTRGGLGLGLSLVRGIAELHGGTVRARSDGVGNGAELVVTLPAAEPVDWHEAAPGVSAAAVRRRVLVVEDDEDAAQSLRDVLELLGGHDVEVAHDGELGIEAARRLRPDVVLCDVSLPKVDGHEVARRLREDGAAPQARLVALSGHAAPEDVERALRAGFDYHLAKPPDVDRLLALVAEAGSAARLDLPPALTTGRHEVDAQHASMLAEAARVRTARPEEIWDAVRFLQYYTASHFTYEEELMEDVSYPGLRPHRQQHRDFTAEFLRLRAKLEREGTTAENTCALADAVEAWVTQHVLDSDQRLAEFIRERSIGVG